MGTSATVCSDRLADTVFISDLVSVLGEDCFEERLRRALSIQRLTDHFTFLEVNEQDRAPFALMTGTQGGGDLVERLTDRYVGEYYRQDPVYRRLTSGWQPNVFVHQAVHELDRQYRSIFFSSSDVIEKASVSCQIGHRLILVNFYATTSRRGFQDADLLRMRELCPLLASLLVRHKELARVLRRGSEEHNDLQRAAQKRNQRLTKRELQVASGILAGQSSKAIGTQLGIATSSVLTFRKSLFRRLGIVSQSQLFALASPDRTTPSEAGRLC